MTFTFGTYTPLAEFLLRLEICIAAQGKVGHFWPYLAAELIDPDTRVGGTRSRLTRGLEQSLRRAFF